MEDSQSWEAAEDYIQKNILKKYPESRSGIWFRGQANCQWPLDTTLERRLERLGKRQLTFYEYHHLAWRVKPAIETFTGSHWDLPSLQDVDSWAKEYYDARLESPVLAPEYLTHLRHHGFPSPLLDWTGSPYIAAYFAFSSAKPGDSVAIYAFCERPLNMKSGSSNEPQIRTLGPYVKTHRRHFLQKSRYSICAQYVVNQGWHYVSHQKFFDAARGLVQDALWKITIPGSEREKVLRQLDQYNINAFSLFDTEDSLMEMLAMQEIDQASP
jgi:hypothetical protein